jgi:outer membrane protein assembly factor BamA
MKRLSVLSMLVLVAASSLAYAQEQTGSADVNRAALLAAERDRKATETTPPERTSVERALYWYDTQSLFAKLSGNWHGFHLAGGGFPAGAGTTPGIGFDRVLGSAQDPNRANRIDVTALAARSTRGYTRVSAGAGVSRIAGAPVDLRVRAQRYEFPQEDFFGLGSNSRTEDRTNYLQEGTEVGAAVRWKPARTIEFGGGVALASPTIGSGTDSRYLSTEQVFDPSTLPGYAEQPDFLRTDASAAFDWRDNPLHPHAGGRYRVQLSSYRDRDLDAFDFNRVEVELQQYLPLPNRYRTLAFRAAAVLTDPGAGQDVPFFYQPTLGGGQELRGFREFRFRDRNSLVMTAEYRWEASWMLDGALFVDAGTVAHERSDVNLRNLDVSYGVGFRVHSNRAFVTRLDLAVSREGFIPLLRFEHVF